MNTENFYRIWDTEAETWFSTGRGKTIWSGKGHAKNAFNIAKGVQYRRDDSLKFDNQDRYVMVLVTAVPWERWRDAVSDSRTYQSLKETGVC